MTTTNNATTTIKTGTGTLRSFLTANKMSQDNIETVESFYEMTLKERGDQKLFTFLKSKGFTSSDLDLISTFYKMPYRLSFGKHSGKTVLEVKNIDCSYLNWLKKLDNPNARLKEALLSC